MKRRAAAHLVRERLTENPAVALLGPRQSGKTTLARALGGAYFDVEQPDERVRLDLEWDDLVRGRRRIVIDEAQAWPELFPRIRAAIDADRRRVGRFLLLGSVSPALMREVSESLAGRLALVELSPFLLSEVGQRALGRLWLTGGFPDGGVLGSKRFPHWQRDYVTLLAQRDLPTWGLPARPQVTERLLAMLAAVHGQVWNASRLGQSLGLSYHTVGSYLDFLAGAFLVRRLAPFSANLSKRLVKSPKVYLRDSGVLHAVLGVSSRDELLRHPIAGVSFEGFVIEQVLGHLGSRGVPHEAFFFRTSDGHELDLLLSISGRSVALEVKLAASASSEDMSRLKTAADLVHAEHRYIVCQTQRPALDATRGVLDLPTLLRRLDALSGGRTRARQRGVVA
ncbi:MAG: ATP-binding protein [Polyangiaceae bacterium]|nr:ATP-binding protein [Polyangiaceae bacterium]